MAPSPSPRWLEAQGSRSVRVGSFPDRGLCGPNADGREAMWPADGPVWTTRPRVTVTAFTGGQRARRPARGSGPRPAGHGPGFTATDAFREPLRWPETHRQQPRSRPPRGGSPPRFRPCLKRPRRPRAPCCHPLRGAWPVRPTCGASTATAHAGRRPPLPRLGSARTDLRQPPARGLRRRRPPSARARTRASNPRRPGRRAGGLCSALTSELLVPAIARHRPSLPSCWHRSACDAGGATTTVSRRAPG